MRAEPQDLDAYVTLSRERAASPPAWPRTTGGQGCRSGLSVVAVEVVMNHAGEGPKQSVTPSTFFLFTTISLDKMRYVWRGRVFALGTGMQRFRHLAGVRPFWYSASVCCRGKRSDGIEEATTGSG